ncbi:MAG: response regulator [Verrucomicrobia bacterium]|nr:response regulator [Verrucomicrobiota bacterium]
MNTSEPLSVLIAEDDPLINDGTAKQVTRLGYPVAGQAYDGPQAVELASQTHPSVVLMDLCMIDPDTGRDDPHAGLKAARTLQESYEAPVILLTAHESQQLVQEAGDAGVSAYVVKPARDNDLGRAITIARARFDDLLELRRLSTELQRQNEKLRAAQATVRTLRGLLPMCAACKKIRDDRGTWQAVENYVQERSEARFSHSLCPECCTKLYPDIAAAVLGS